MSGGPAGLLDPRAGGAQAEPIPFAQTSKELVASAPASRGSGSPARAGGGICRAPGCEAGGGYSVSAGSAGGVAGACGPAAGDAHRGGAGSGGGGGFAVDGVSGSPGEAL